MVLLNLDYTKNDKHARQTNRRILIDNRKLNEKIVGDRHLLPNIDELLDKFDRYQYFSTLVTGRKRNSFQYDEWTLQNSSKAFRFEIFSCDLSI